MGIDFVTEFESSPGSPVFGAADGFPSEARGSIPGGKGGGVEALGDPTEKAGLPEWLDNSLCINSGSILEAMPSEMALGSRFPAVSLLNGVFLANDCSSFDGTTSDVGIDGSPFKGNVGAEPVRTCDCPVLFTIAMPEACTPGETLSDAILGEASAPEIAKIPFDDLAFGEVAFVEGAIKGLEDWAAGRVVSGLFEGSFLWSSETIEGESDEVFLWEGLLDEECGER